MSFVENKVLHLGLRSKNRSKM